MQERAGRGRERVNQNFEPAPRQAPTKPRELIYRRRAEREVRFNGRAVFPEELGELSDFPRTRP